METKENLLEMNCTEMTIFIFKSCILFYLVANIELYHMHLILT